MSRPVRVPLARPLAMGMTTLALSAGLAAPAAAAAKAEPLTLPQLQSVAVPALCGHPAGKLVDGSLPGIVAGAGSVRLAATAAHHGANTLAFGDLTDDGVADAAAVVTCSTGSTALASSIQLYTSGGRRLGGLDLAAYTKRPTDVVASVAISHRTVVVHWSVNQQGDAPCCPSLDYSVDLTVKGTKVIPSHTHSYTDSHVADQLAAYIRGGNTKAALTMASAHVVAQMRAASRSGVLGSVYKTFGSPRNYAASYAIFYRLGVRGSSIPSWLNSNDRYAEGDPFNEKAALIRLHHLGWRRWKADYFVVAKVQG